MKRVLFSSLLLLLLTSTIVVAQRDSLRSIFLNAESWFLFEEYADALPLYEGLLKNDPGNDNLNYKIGVCLLNDPYQKDKSITHLMSASDNINPDYKENSFKERTAPPDVLYYLGNAYLANELLDRAIATFEEFLTVMDPEVYDEELVKAQIRSCENAKRLKTMPVDLDLTLVDPMINTRYADINPVISGDGSKMAFVTRLPFYDGAFYTEKTETGWSYPQIITQALGFDADIYPVCLSYDGSEIILYYDDDYIGNLYYSKFENGSWAPATKMGENISTKYWESHACFSKDGQSLYLTSNRKGSLGGLDIYISGRQPDGTWGVPVNLGGTINTRYNEECPFISVDGQTLYFSSYGHYNMGGYDIFFSKKGPDGQWGEPVNIGYPVNTTDDDLFYQPVNKGNNAYYSVYSPQGVGRHDIYYMNIYSADNPRFYSISGHLRTADGAIDSTRMAIYLIDAASGDTVVYTQPREDGNFELKASQGIYDLHFTGDGYESLIRPLHVTAGSDKAGILLSDEITLAQLAVEPVIVEGEECLIQVEETAYEGVTGVPLLIEVKAPKDSEIIVRTWQNDSLVSTDTLVMRRKKAELEIVPLPGKSVVELEFLDEDGNIHRKRFDMLGTVPTDVGTDPAKIADENALEEKDEADVAAGTDVATGTDVAAAEAEVDHLLVEAVSEGEVEQLREKLLHTASPEIQAILEKINLHNEGISTTEQLIALISQKLKEDGFSDKAIQEMLYKAGLSDIQPGVSGEDKASGWLWLLLFLPIGGWLFWFLIFRQKRRDQTS